MVSSYPAAHRISNWNAHQHPGEEIVNEPPHYHCPNDCEKPQPSIYDGKAYCMRCMAEGRGTVEMFLCTPEVCDDANEAASNVANGAG